MFWVTEYLAQVRGTRQSEKSGLIHVCSAVLLPRREMLCWAMRGLAQVRWARLSETSYVTLVACSLRRGSLAWARQAWSLKLRLLAQASLVQLVCIVCTLWCKCGSGDDVPWAVHGWCLACDGMSEEVHTRLLFCGNTSEVGSYVSCPQLRDGACGEVRSLWITCVGLCAGMSVE